MTSSATRLSMLLASMALACAAALPACSDEDVVLEQVDATSIPDAAIDAQPQPLDASLAVTRQPLRCQAGVYEGTSAGFYRSEPAGVCGIVAGQVEPGGGKWSFVLRNEGDGEFFSVRGGCLRFEEGETLRDGGTNYGHRAEIIGKVDCATGLLDAELRGTYIAVGVCDLGQVWTHYFYRGYLRGRFDPQQNRFVDTSYYIAERPPLLGEPAGGGGTWTGTWNGDAGEPVTPPGSCLDIEFPDDLKPRPLEP